MEATLRDLTIEHLGRDANELDLQEFRQAVEAYICEACGIDEATAMDYVWGDGDFTRRLYGGSCPSCHRIVSVEI